MDTGQIRAVQIQYTIFLIIFEGFGADLTYRRPGNYKSNVKGL